jgi:hypothetical protein
VDVLELHQPMSCRQHRGGHKSETLGGIGPWNPPLTKNVKDGAPGHTLQLRNLRWIPPGIRAASGSESGRDHGADRPPIKKGFSLGLGIEPS